MSTIFTLDRKANEQLGTARRRTPRLDTFIVDDSSRKRMDYRWKKEWRSKIDEAKFEWRKGKISRRGEMKDLLIGVIELWGNLSLFITDLFLIFPYSR